jgi:hypothetical protein
MTDQEIWRLNVFTLEKAVKFAGNRAGVAGFLAGLAGSVTGTIIGSDGMILFQVERPSPRPDWKTTVQGLGLPFRE